MTIRPLHLQIQISHGRWSWLTILLCAVAAAFLLVASQNWRLVAAEKETWTAALARQGARQSLQVPASRSPGKIDPVVAARIKALNPLIRQLNLSWDEIFDAIRVPPALPVQLLGLETLGQGDGVRLHGRADRAEAMLDYVKALEQGGLLHQVFLTKHEQKAPGDYYFEVEAKWLGGH